MLEVITINKNEKEVNEIQWKDLLIDAYNNTYKNNDFNIEITRKTDLDDFWTNLDSDVAHVVLKQNKFIGFFIRQINETNKEISFKIFVYSRACPMSLRSLTKCALISCLLVYLENQNTIDKFEFVTWHPSLISVVKNFLTLKTHFITSNYIIGYSSFKEENPETLDLLVKKYLEDSTNINYDKFRVIN